ncbi:MAG: gamma-glutamyl-gamma-aminobutyrate hydrolase family protein [Gemmataceae bacterium]
MQRDRPIIGFISQSQEMLAGVRPACWMVGQRYVNVLVKAGAIPWLIPLLSDDSATLRGIYEQLDGIFLPGGVDVDPQNYGEERQAACGLSDPPRDWTEIKLIEWALADGKPILGVCRGLQVLNVACGGSLYQHLEGQLPDAIKHDYFPSPTAPNRDFLAHTIQATKYTRLAHLMGHSPLHVNSMHHQGIKRLGQGLRVSAQAPDGLIEGKESDGGHYLLAVQWHPEELAEQHAPHARLFSDFVGACADFQRY